MGAKSEEFDPVNKPKHYADSKIEVIEYIEDKEFDFCLGNAVKYISRAGKKDRSKTIEDLKKAVWYIVREIWHLSYNDNDFKTSYNNILEEMKVK